MKRGPGEVRNTVSGAECYLRSSRGLDIGEAVGENVERDRVKPRWMCGSKEILDEIASHICGWMLPGDGLAGSPRCARSTAADPSPRGQRRPFLLRIAVAVVVIGALGVAIGYSLQPSMKTYGTVTGNRETVTLADGSTIELNTDTVLRVSDDEPAE